MRAAGIETFGGKVQMLELAAPQSLAPDEIVIAVRAAGVGNWDEIVRVGGWDVGRQPPLVLGVEAAGVVLAVGEEAASLAPGDEVLTHPVPLRHSGHLEGEAARPIHEPLSPRAQARFRTRGSTAAAFPVCRAPRPIRGERGCSCYGACGVDRGTRRGS